MDDRRILAFSGLVEVMPEVDRLLLGHRTGGNWTLAQICNHLSDAFRLSVEGFPNGAPWLVQRLAGPVVKRRLFSRGVMPTGLKIPEKYAPKSGLDDRAEVEALRGAIRLFLCEPGPLASHPMLGPLTVDDWHRFHCIHSAHHLGFVVPEAAGTR